MQIIDKDWYGKSCPKVGFEIIKSVDWTFKVEVPLPVEKHPLAKQGQYKEGLWEQDVAEWFIVNPVTGRYIETNLSSNGAFWIMIFDSARQRAEIPDIARVFTQSAGIVTQSSHDKNGWKSKIEIPEKLLLNVLGEANWTHNVCFILGKQPRHYLSLNKLNSETPDFHRPDEIIIPLRNK